MLDSFGCTQRVTRTTYRNGAGQENAFLNHYGRNVINLNEFTVEMNDDDAVKLIAPTLPPTAPTCSATFARRAIPWSRPSGSHRAKPTSMSLARWNSQLRE